MPQNVSICIVFLGEFVKTINFIDQNPHFDLLLSLTHNKNLLVIMGKTVIVSGAGLSAESGIPTFRDKGGLWEKYDIDEVANFCTFYQNKPAVFRFFNEFRRLIKTIEPNHAHKRLALLQEEYGPERVLLVTQNVDDLLERAGCSNVLHVHGFLTEMQCLACGHVWDIGYEPCALYSTCPGCEADDIKPNVVLFNEVAPRYRDMYALVDGLQPDDCLVALGTSGTVVPVAELVSGRQCTKILCNLEPCYTMQEDVFDHRFYKPVTGAIDDIAVHIEDILEHKAATAENSI